LEGKKGKESGTKIKFPHFLLAAVIAASFGYLARVVHIGIFEFLFGTIAVLGVGFVVFVPFEVNKAKQRHRKYLEDLAAYSSQNTVRSCPITAKRIAVAAEYEDEGDLFIIEYDTDRVLFLWDYDYNLRKRFPCLDFEIYEERFAKLVGRQVYATGKPLSGVMIDKKAKWNYLRKVNWPANLTTLDVNFDQLVFDMNADRG
jgi:hypothetical protein